MSAKLALGTVQFGTAYGATNKVGQTPVASVKTILQDAHRFDPAMILDTAAGYGESEAVLGQFIHKTPLSSFRVITKVAPTAKDILTGLRDSLERLERPSIYGYLDHNAAHLLGAQNKEGIAAFREVKESGLVEKIGASLYSGDEIDRLLEIMTPDIVQIPLNALDQRLIRSGHLKKMKERDIEIHVRSVFLQGILLEDAANLPAQFNPHRASLEKFDALCRSHKMTRLQGALSFARSVSEVDTLVIGVTTPQEWVAILSAWKTLPDSMIDWGVVACDDPKLLNPALWPKTA